MAISPTEIMVTWDIVPEIDQNGVITMYEVLYVPLETFDGAVGPLSVNVTEQMTTLTDLQEYVNYTISVRAYTSVGAGPYSAGVIVETLEDGKMRKFKLHNIICTHIYTEPASSPSNVVAMNTSATSITVMWDIVPEIDQNGVITMYEVLYVPLETFSGAIGENAINVTVMMANLTDLEGYVNYNISVRAYTEIGAGPYSEPVTELTPQTGTIIQLVHSYQYRWSF